jgi:hypothetical protein
MNGVIIYVGECNGFVLLFLDLPGLDSFYYRIRHGEFCELISRDTPSDPDAKHLVASMKVSGESKAYESAGSLGHCDGLWIVFVCLCVCLKWQLAVLLEIKRSSSENCSRAGCRRYTALWGGGG